MLRLGTPFVLVVFLWSISVTGQELSLGDTPAVGGIIANLGQIPHAVVVLSKHGKCTGALIHSSWVLTAGHCVSDHRGKPVGSKELEVIGGVVDYKELGPTAQKRTGVQILVHPEYGHGQLGKHDIALVKVEPFELNKFVSAIKFSQKEWPQDRRMLNRSCVSAGWGMLAGRQVTSVLHLQKTIAKHGEKSCSCVPKNYINKRVVCLAAESTVGICFGDSGGALVCDDEIVGVAHMVMDKRSCSYFKAPESTIRCESQYVFGIYMYTCPYLNWIKQYVPGVTSSPASCKAPKISSLLKSSWFLILIVIVSYF